MRKKCNKKSFAFGIFVTNFIIFADVECLNYKHEKHKTSDGPRDQSVHAVCM